MKAEAIVREANRNCATSSPHSIWTYIEIQSSAMPLIRFCLLRWDFSLSFPLPRSKSHNLHFSCQLFSIVTTDKNKFHVWIDKHGNDFSSSFCLSTFLTITLAWGDILPSTWHHDLTLAGGREKLHDSALLLWLILPLDTWWCAKLQEICLMDNIPESIRDQMCGTFEIC